MSVDAKCLIAWTDQHQITLNLEEQMERQMALGHDLVGLKVSFDNQKKNLGLQSGKKATNCVSDYVINLKTI